MGFGDGLWTCCRFHRIPVGFAPKNAPAVTQQRGRNLVFPTPAGNRGWVVLGDNPGQPGDGFWKQVIPLGRGRSKQEGWGWQHIPCGVVSWWDLWEEMGRGSSLGWLQLPAEQGLVCSSPGTAAITFFLLLFPLPRVPWGSKGREGVWGTWFGVCLFAQWFHRQCGCSGLPFCAQRMEVESKENKEILLLPCWVGPALGCNPRVCAKPSPPPQTAPAGHGGAPGVGSEPSFGFKCHCVTRGCHVPFRASVSRL